MRGRPGRVIWEAVSDEAVSPAPPGRCVVSWIEFFETRQFHRSLYIWGPRCGGPLAREQIDTLLRPSWSKNSQG